MSRAHALLISYFGYPAILDLLSENHTFVNDKPVTYAVLKNDDIVTIGDSKFRVRLIESGVSKRAPTPSPPAPEPVTLEPQGRPSDLIDIEATEGAHQWRIAESLQKAARNR